MFRLTLSVLFVSLQLCHSLYVRDAKSKSVSPLVKTLTANEAKIAKASEEKATLNVEQDPNIVSEMHGSKAYIVVKTEMKWSEAEEFCVNKFANGHLASIASEEENEYVQSVVKAQSFNKAWVGLKGNAKGFAWSDGGKNLFVDWKNNSPGNSPNKAVATFRNGWKAFPKTQKLAFICKADSFDEVNEEPKPEEVCQTHGGMAYTVVTLKKSWQEAEKYCAELPNGHLASIHGKQERNFINNDLVGPFADKSEVWIGYCNSGKGDYQWSDGSRKNVNFWSSDEPNGSGKRCAVVKRKGRKIKWFSEDPDSKRFFVCKSSACRDGEIPNECTTASLFNDRFFSIVDETRRFEEAEWICNLMGGHLASVHSEAENNFIKQLMLQEGINSLAIGLNDVVSEGTFVYTDGTPVDYVDWVNEKVENPSGNAKDVVRIQKRGRNMVWVQSNRRSGNEFVCASFNCPPELIIPAVGEANPCPHAERIGDRYFQLIRKKAKFADAEAMCEKLGGHLASVHNNEEDHLIKKYLRSSGNINHVRIGGKQKVGVWTWTDGTEWDYTGWAGEEPGATPARGHTIYYKKDRKEVGNRAWYNLQYNRKLPYLCASAVCPKKPQIPEREDVCSCTCSGDPHCQSFDGRKVNYQGACLYVLAEDNCVNGFPSGKKPNFMVVADQFRRDPLTKPVTWLFEILVILPASGITVKMTREQDVFINDVAIKTFPNYIGKDISVTKSTRSMRFMAETLGLEVVSTGKSLEVLVSKNSKGNLCGICGDCDDDKSNDWTVGPNSTCADQYPGKWPTAGATTKSTTMFGDSWLYALDPTEPDLCTCKPPEAEPCTEDQKGHAKEVCQALISPLSAFAECLEELPAIFETAVEDCMFDVCLTGVTASVCEAGLSVAKECLAGGISIEGWRAINEECHTECLENQHYEGAGNTCEATCKDPTGESCEGEFEVYEEGCFCDEGFYRDGEDCIETCPTLPPSTTPQPTVPTAPPIPTGE